MGTSYQDIDIRLKRLEALVNFMASTIQMKAVVSSPIVDGSGEPSKRMVQGSMWDLFRLTNQLPTVLQSDIESSVVKSEEIVKNG